MKALNRLSLTADRETVARLLQSLPMSDVLGRLSFEARLGEIDRALAELDGHRDTIGRVALMFAGGPVQGSRSINADFAANVVVAFQDLVSKCLALEEVGPLGARGPVALRTASDLVLTDVVRGSFGLVLEESAVNDQIADTAVKTAIDEVTKVIARTASESDADFEAAVESVDSRFLSALREFFRTLDDSSAVVRIVEDDRDERLDAGAIRRARVRVDRTEITEQDAVEIVGELLGLLPGARRFELRTAGSNEIIRGSVSRAVIPRYQAMMHDLDGRLVGARWRTRMRVREVRERNKPAKRIYTLLGLTERIDEQAD